MSVLEIDVTYKAGDYFVWDLSVHTQQPVIYSIELILKTSDENQ